jgi:hypothetical protein
LTRSTTVRCVVTGSSRATPSSVAFSISQSVWLRLTGAKASQTSGIASASRVRRSTASVIRFLPASAMRASHSPLRPSNSSSSPLSFMRSTLPR